jgi:hypothetical protein
MTESKQFTLKVTQEQVTIIGNALAQLPFIQVSDLLNGLQKQIDEQTAPVEEYIGTQDVNLDAIKKFSDKKKK